MALLRDSDVGACKDKLPNVLKGRYYDNNVDENIMRIVQV